LIVTIDRKRNTGENDMPIFKIRKILSAVALCSAVLLAPTSAVTQDKPDAGARAITARQGFMQVVGWEVGPLFGMAKGEMAYDASAATASAANLNAITDYSVDRLFVPGTAKAERPGKTRALAEIWADPARFAKALEDWRAAVAVVAAEAGKGQAQLAAAVGALGKTCGGCHKPFRAKEF
jgi:cytochrome c556